MCPDESMFTQLAAGQVTAQVRESLEMHLAECPACRERYEGIQRIHELLGEWTVSPPPVDLSGAVLQAARQQTAGRPWWMLAAAAVLLAGSGGMIAGLLIPARMQAATPVSDEQVVEAVGIDVLAGNADVFAPLLLAADEPAADGKEPL